MKKKHLLYVAVMSALVGVLMGVDYLLYLGYGLIQRVVPVFPKLTYWQVFFGLSIFGLVLFFIIRIYRKIFNKE